MKARPVELDVPKGEGGNARAVLDSSSKFSRLRSWTTQPASLSRLAAPSHGSIKNRYTRNQFSKKRKRSDFVRS
jgi:hypothetical protein